MNRTATWFLAILAALLAVLAIYLTPLSGGGRANWTPGGFAVDFDPNTVESIEISRGESELRFQRTPTGWDVGPEPADRASTREILRLLELAASARILDIIPAREFDRSLRNASFGFSPEKYRLVLRFPKRSIDLLFGDEAVGGDRVYVRVGDSMDTMILSTELLDAILQPVETFRDPRLADFPETLVDKVRIETGSGAVSLEKRGADWWITSPLHAPADNERVAGALGKFLGARVLAFTGDASPNGLPGMSRVHVWPEGEDVPVVFLLGADAESTMWIAVNPLRPGRMRIAPDNASIASLSLDDLREHRFLRVNPDLVDRIVFRVDGRSAICSRVPGGWEFRDETRNGAIDSSAVASALRELGELRATRFTPISLLDGQPRNFTSPRIEIQLQSRLSENTPEEQAGIFPLASLLVAPSTEPDGGAYARLGDTAEAALLAPQTLAKISEILARLTAPD